MIYDWMINDMEFRIQKIEMEIIMEEREKKRGKEGEKIMMGI